jgi:thiol-disulfide isomerase/thioredoxin
VEPTQAAISAYPSPPTGSYPTPIGAYPGPQTGVVPTTSGAYPLPAPGAGQNQPTQGPYPDPANNPSGAYPPPIGQNGTGTTNPYPSPNTGAYPGPTTQAATATQAVSTNVPTPTPLPTFAGGATPTPGAFPTASPTATASATAVFTPTATPVPSLRTDLLATDPSTVKLASGKPELIVFFAYWDGNSRIMMPALLNLQDQYGSRVNFVYLDRDNPATAQLKRALYYDDYDTKPQIFLLDSEGKILRKWKGVVPQLDLQQAIQAATGG